MADTAPAAPTAAEIPLFPLGTVLFEGGQLPLRIFEPRYVDMISHCMKSSIGFGVVLIRSGSELRGAPAPKRISKTSMPCLMGRLAWWPVGGESLRWAPPGSKVMA